MQTQTEINQIVNHFNNEDDSFTRLYELTEKTVYYTIKVSISNLSNEEIEDIMQETYITVYNSISSVKEEKAIMSWIKTIAYNKAIDYIRRNRKEVLLDENSENFIYNQVSEDKYSSPEDVALLEDGASTMSILLGCLNEYQREALILRYYNDKTMDEIATSMNIPVNSVKTHLSRGKKKLQQLIKDKEKHGVRMFSFVPIPFMVLLFRKTFEATRVPVEITSSCKKATIGASITSVFTHGSVVTAVKTLAIGGSKHIGSLAIKGMVAKIACIAAVVAATGTMATLAVVNNRNLNQNNHSKPAVNIMTEEDILSEYASFNYKGHQYYLIPEMDFEGAVKLARKSGTHLATITSADEDENVYKGVTNNGYDSIFFGLIRNDDGEWKWITGEKFDYSNWAEGEPNFQNDEEFYGMYYMKFDDGKWNDGKDGNDSDAWLLERDK